MKKHSINTIKFTYNKILLPVATWYGNQVLKAFKHLAISLTHFTITIGLVIVAVGMVQALVSGDSWREYAQNVQQLPSVILQQAVQGSQAENTTSQGLF